MDSTSRIYVAGHTGMIGSAMLRLLSKEGYKNTVTRDRASLDLTQADAVNRFFREEKPEYVVLAAGRTGGILDNERVPVEFLQINLSIALHVMAAAHANNAKKLIFLCSSCMYPSHCPQPMKEDQLLTGRPEVTSLGTAISKLAGMQLCLAYNHQYGETRFIPIIPNNTYGPNDNFNPATGHVLSSLIHRFHEAKSTGRQSVELWGSGNPRREFLHADDVAGACLMFLKTAVAADDLPMNVGLGKDYSIKELAEIIARIIGFSGTITWNTQKPDGAPRKLLDSSRINKLGWNPQISLEAGIKDTYQWYVKKLENV